MATGQGLPLSFIVIAAISALVLVLVIAFTIGGLGGFFRQITIAGGSEDVGVVQSACTTACNRLVTATSASQFESSDYCRRTFTVDLDKDGEVEENEQGLHCWDSQPLSIDTGCSVQIGSEILTEQNCPDFLEAGGTGF